MRIRLIADGKIKDAALRALEADYSARLRHFTELVIEETPPGRGAGAKSGTRSGQSGHSDRGSPSPAERRLLERVSGSTTICLDAAGREWTSQQFAEWLGKQALSGMRELAFLVGGAEGFSAAFKQQADLVLALSRMTLTHDWARVLLLEQIYRAFTILRGYPYAR
ncbi:MAG TPA: 23S rRNA (pseudouridine(1915)-N(3))-methyltransferase RlmH [Terriglobia bacterium]|nr:23S rRNA (pseudouridine(1915)-N(3))-methyltransferase RlmH [Terriglobia bacterium]